ncbi:MAG: DUF362 domain-containing protein [Deltaproteobacteria bacterium]|jgi:uncharacterized protein (DUF362 family)|nr:DUF362 domain-containing protein [Deltaproteobacteria bacterium]
MRRRDFLKWQIAGAACLATGFGRTNFSNALAADTPRTYPDVAVVKGDPAKATRAAVDMLGGMGRFVKAGHKVVIKPNMSFARTVELGTNTHPLIVREVLVMCKEAGAAKVRVLDHSLQDPEQALVLSGIRAACDGIEPGICHHLMDNSFYREAALPDAVEMRSNLFMKDVLEADVLIAVPVAKSHGSAGVSLSMKGQMGLIWERKIMHGRYSLDVSLVDLAQRIKPTLAVIDATRVLTTGGPGGPGKIITPGEIIASADPVAADATAVASYEWYGRMMQPRQVAHIRLAHERGIGRMDIENLQTQRIRV